MRCLVVFVGLAALACAEIRSTPPEGPGVTYCELLPEVQCIDSPRCTLDIVRRPQTWYACRESVDLCEKGFRQSDGTSEACHAQPGCRFVPSNCYCAPAVACVCGGGNPPNCETVSDRSS